MPPPVLTTKEPIITTMSMSIAPQRSKMKKRQAISNAWAAKRPTKNGRAFNANRVGGEITTGAGQNMVRNPGAQPQLLTRQQLAPVGPAGPPEGGMELLPAVTSRGHVAYVVGLCIEAATLASGNWAKMA
mmetsp:Transcript_18588/g.53247  ORF Transcript_18588/g.53247 Transcript_18588/m.53247 type:complete len:130 (-) Transcript_18588:3-392(-)